MNNARRGKLAKIVETLGEELGKLQELADEEDGVKQNMESGGLEYTENYYIADRASDALTEAVNNLEEVISSIEEAIG